MRFIFYAITITCINVSCFQQEHDEITSIKGLGEGVITIVHYNTEYYANNKVLKENIFNTMTYFIKTDKVLRKDTSENFSRSSTTKKENNNNVNLTHSLSATLVRPTYIINWEKKKTYTFYINKGKQYISEDSLINCASEILYKSFYAWNPKRFSGVYFLEKQAKEVAGFKCQSAYYMDMEKSDTIRFWYTEEPMPIKSPINNFIPNFPHDILKLELNAYQQDSSIGRIGFEVVNISKSTLNDSLFHIPSSIPIKKNVPLIEMFNSKKK